ncbi:hypothetical protein D0B54_18000 [Solimonas sp. K1W22B-7]|uniref:hypothetical protein n=1 Tax=Solimonas sp. K1W22B-7 TaxID=2303331 RepID=UPI000E3356C7|nr:hypothetical protein [Solimonas sp. K1W22B-7]AXQ30454.1 hypothetical protein D0B54_18000 [Solimonas sp. K1W22B-7]
MTTSAIYFGGGAAFVRDPDIRELLKAIGLNFMAYMEGPGAAIDWLPEVCKAWMDDHENSAPGLRDIELEEALTTPERKAGFVAYLHWLLLRVPPDNMYDMKIASAAIDRILALLSEATEPT